MTLEFLELLSGKVDIRIVTCKNSNREFVDNLKLLGPVYEVICSKDMGYPVMAVNEVESLVNEVDLVWLTDVVLLVAPKIKRIRRDIPIVAHLHSYALICPWWGALYGFRDVCVERCSAWRITRCKQEINKELAGIGILGRFRADLYYFMDFAKGPADFARWRWLMRGVLDSIDGFIPVSHSLWDIHVAHIPELKGKPHAVIYNPVTLPLKYVKPDPDEPYGDYILYASGSNPVKGPHILLDTWRQLEREYSELKLVMVGCKGSWVEKRAQKLGLKNILIMEKMPPHQYYDMMYSAKAVVMPSVWPEPFGRIPVEANRLGVPAIASDRGALREIINEPGGVLWKCCSSENLAKAIMLTLSKSHPRQVIIEESYRKIEPMSIVKSLLAFFEKFA